MKLSDVAAIGVLFLVAVMRKSSSQSDLCLLNRLDHAPCSFRVSSTPMAEENELGLYSTRINIDESTCDIRRRNHQLRTIQTIGGDPRLLLLYSPGYELADPEDYGNEMIVFYNVSCPANHIGYFNITEIDMEGRTCPDDSSGSTVMRCVDFVIVNDVIDSDDSNDSGFGPTESCGTDAGDNRDRLSLGNIRVTFRTSDSGRFPGFKATMTCIDRSTNASTSGDSRRKRTTDVADIFDSELERQIDFVRRITRYYQYTGYYEYYLRLFPWLFRLETVIIKFGESIRYRNNRLTTFQGSNGQLFSSVLVIKILNGDGEVTVYKRSARNRARRLITLPGPGTLTVVGCTAFYQQFIVSTKNILPLTLDQQNFVYELTTQAFDTQVLEVPEQRLCDELLEPSETPIDDNDLSIPECPRSNITLPVNCNYTDDQLLRALADRNSSNALVRTIVDVVLNCTRRQSPGRLEQLIRSFNANCSFTISGSSLSIDCSGNRAGVRVRSCSIVDSSGRSVPLGTLCAFPSFTFSVGGLGLRSGDQTLRIELVDSEGSSVTSDLEFFIPLFVSCTSRFGFSTYTNITCTSNQDRLTITECLLDGEIPLQQCAFPGFLVNTADLSSGEHNVTATFMDQSESSVTITIGFTVFAEL